MQQIRDAIRRIQAAGFGVWADDGIPGLYHVAQHGELTVGQLLQVASRFAPAPPLSPDGTNT